MYDGNTVQNCLQTHRSRRHRLLTNLPGLVGFASGATFDEGGVFHKANPKISAVNDVGELLDRESQLLVECRVGVLVQVVDMNKRLFDNSLERSGMESCHLRRDVVVVI